MSNLRIGQKVVLVDTFGPIALSKTQKYGVVLPMKGTVYTVRSLHAVGDDVDRLALRLVEIVNRPWWENGKEPVFEADMFRPVVSKPTSIAVFQAMLAPSKAKELV